MNRFANPAAVVVALIVLGACGGPRTERDDEDDTSESGVTNDASDAGDAPTNEVTFGPPCESDDGCASGFCAPTGVCVSVCSESADCTPGWRCDPRPELGVRACVCDAPDAEALDFADNDCDGDIDEGLARVGFWNVRQLSANSRDDQEREQIATVLRGYDLILLAEVQDDAITVDLTSRAADGRSMGHYVSEPVGNSAGSAERIAAIWDQSIFELEEAEALAEIETSTGDPFGREPVLTHFRTVDTGDTFAVLTVHVVWGAGEEAREAEVAALAHYVNEARAWDDAVVLAGDLNLNVGTDAVATLAQEAGLTNTTAPRPPTKVDSDNTYDQILVDIDALQTFTGDAGVDLFDQWLFLGDADAAELAASDHRPVWIGLRVAPESNEGSARR